MRVLSSICCALLSLSLLTACGRDLSSSTYTSSSTYSLTMQGVILTKRAITIKDTDKLSENGIEFNSEGDIKISCSGTLELSADGQIQINSTTSDVNIEALNISQNANAEYKVEATASLELNTSGVSKIQGSIVQIN